MHGVTMKIEKKSEVYLKIQFVPRSKHTSLHYFDAVYTVPVLRHCDSDNKNQSLNPVEGTKLSLISHPHKTVSHSVDKQNI